MSRNCGEKPEVPAAINLACQGRNKRGPVGRGKREPVVGRDKQVFRGEKGFWSVAEEAILPPEACSAGGQLPAVVVRLRRLCLRR